MNARTLQESIFKLQKQQITDLLEQAPLTQDQKAEGIKVAELVATRLIVKLFEVCSDEELEHLEKTLTLNTSEIGKRVQAKLNPILVQEMTRSFQF